jgi:hypothetical protein
MALTFPANPVNGQIYDQYVYSSTSQSWRVYGSDTGITSVLATKANLSGGNTFTGSQTFNSGNVLVPSQVGFLAYRTDGSFTPTVNTDIIWNNVTHNDGNGYNTSNGRFTAPVAGKYLFVYNQYFRGTYDARAFIYVNGNTVAIMHQAGRGETSHSATRIVKLAAGDYVTCRNVNAGELFVSIDHSWFFGQLIG